MTVAAKFACSIASGCSCGQRGGPWPAQQLGVQTLNNQPSPAAMILFMIPMVPAPHRGENVM